MPQKKSQEGKKIKEIVSLLSLLEKNNMSKKKLFVKLNMKKPKFSFILGLTAQLGYVKTSGRKGRNTIKISKIGSDFLIKMREKGG